jgi:hypothetical protein
MNSKAKLKQTYLGLSKEEFDNIITYWNFMYPKYYVEL